MNPDRHSDPDSHSDPDNYQQAWQAHSSQTRVTLEADVLLRVLQGDQQSFLTVVRLSDSVVVGISLLLLPVWIYLGVTTSSPWTWYLTMPVLVWWAGFTLVYRMRNKWKSKEPDGPLLQCVKESLSQVEDQIWYQRNVFWWNLLPLAVPLLTHAVYSAWLRSDDRWDFLGHMHIVVVFLAIFYFIYRINKSTEGKHEPRRQELLTLLANLGDESGGKPPPTKPVKSVVCPAKPGQWLIVTAGSCLVALVTFVILVAAVLSTWSFDSNYDGPPRSSGPAGDPLAKLIADERKENNFVGLAAMVMVDGQVVAAAAHGERKLGSGVPLEIGDRWHLGGITKSITATMIARLVESGQMKWSDTVGECFPDESMHEDWRPVTLAQLLTDTAGVPVNFPKVVWHKRPPLGPECTLARREAVLDVIAKEPANPPGEKFVYSNVGYVIVGAMAEKASGATWEELVKREVFEPLKLTGAGFGPPKSSNETLEQPRGHRTFLRGKVAVDDEADNTPIMGPSATAHMTLNDLCTLATEHLRGELGEGKLLSAETYKLLHKPELNPYACGWVVQGPTYEIPHTVYWHNGTNTMWYALVVFIPDKNLVVAVTANDGDYQQAEAAAWEIVKASAKKFNGESDAERRESLPTEAFPKKSPFAAVRWHESKPEVKVGKQWYKLVSLDDLPAAEIVAFSKKTYANIWKKRFEEDLVELLTRMGHSPRDTVKLVVQSLTSSETQVLEDIPMTKANRGSIKAAAQARTSWEP